MAWHYGTFACGHEGRVQIYGPLKHREWKAERAFSGLCPTCYEEQKKVDRQIRNEKAAEEAREMGLPELTGTEKQVAWATTIRQDVLKWYEQYIENKWYTTDKITEEQAIEGMDYLLGHQTRAAWWIDNRYDLKDYLGKFLLDAYQKAQLAQRKAEEKELDVEGIVRPENPKTETIAEIRIVGTDLLQIHFPERRDDFRELVKSKLDMKWNDGARCWERKIGYRAGKIEDRAAEAGHRLLAAGFIVKIRDEEIREKAITGSYEPEHTRWVVTFSEGKHTGKFGIIWHRQKEDYYQVARKLPGSSWDNPYVIVRPEHFEEVLDFAERYDFKVSPAAQKLAQAAREAKDRALMVNVSAPEEGGKTVASTKQPKLEVPEVVEIDAELRDED